MSRVSTSSEDFPSTDTGEITPVPRHSSCQSVERNTDKFGFYRGSIMRLRLVNFTVYVEATFNFHPRLNLIIGPNGTGKSSIVQALVFCFNAPASTTGAEADVQQYIQRDKDESAVVVTIANSPGQPPIVIKRHIRRRVQGSRENISTFYIDRKLVPAAKVVRLLEELNIDVQNICQFLPQHKVAALSAATPEVLLREVESAISKTRLSEPHQELCTLDQNISELEKNLSYTQGEIRVAKAKSSELEPRYNELKSLREKQRLLKLMTTLKQEQDYGALNVRLSKLVEELATMRKKKAEIQAAVDPLNKKEKELSSIAAKAKDRYSRCFNENLKVMESIKTTQTKIAKDYYDYEKLDEEFSQMSANSERRRRELASAELACDGYRSQLASMDVPDEDLERSLFKDFSALRSRVNDFVKQREDLDSQLENTRMEENEWISRVKRKQNQLNQLQSRGVSLPRCLDNQKYAAVREVHRLIQQNKSTWFQNPVRGPMLLDISVTDEKIATYVESILLERHLVETFVVESEADYQTFAKRIIEGDQKFRVSVHLHVMTPPVRPAFTHQELRSRFGFDGYLSDLIEADEYTKNWIGHKTNAHRIPYALDENSVNFNAVREVANLIPRYLVAGVNYVTKMHDNDPRTAIITTSNVFPNPRFLSTSSRQENRHQNVEIVNCERECEEANAKALQSRSRHKQLSEKKSALISEITNASFERDQFRAQLEEIKSTKTKRRQIEEQIKEAEKKISELRKVLATADIKIAEKQSELRLEAKNCIDKVVKHAEQVYDNDKVIESVMRKRLAALRMEEANIAATAFRESMNEQLSSYKNVCQELSKMKSDVLRVRNEGLQLRESWEKGMDELAGRSERSEQLEQELQMARRKALKLMSQAQAQTQRMAGLPANFTPSTSLGDALKYAIEELKCALLDSKLDEQAIRVYEDGLKEIKKLEANIKSQHVIIQEKLDERSAKCSQWKSALNEYIGAISANYGDYFSRISCAGEVGIREGTLFNEYALEIRVKFRQSEEMRPLARERQSGGERAVSTMLFLLSLQRFSPSPFILVDEINQGMDAVNERAVHNMIVELSNAENAPQSFVLTPKLLSGLDYSEQMAVHTIFNGPGVHSNLVESEHAFGNVEQHIARLRKQHEAAVTQ